MGPRDEVSFYKLSRKCECPENDRFKEQPHLVSIKRPPINMIMIIFYQRSSPFHRNQFFKTYDPST